MPVLIPVVAGAAASAAIASSAALIAVTGATAAGVIGAIAGGVIAAGTGRLLGLNEQPDNLLDQAKSGRLQNFAGSVEPIPVIYGRRRIGGPFILRESIGNKNEFIYLVVPLSEGPIDAVETIHLGERLSTDSRIVPYFTSEVRLGTSTQTAIPFLVDEVDGWTDAAVGKLLAYVGMRFRWEDDTDGRPVWPNGIPTSTFTIRGRRLFDPRNGLTAYSNNPALAIRDYLTNTLYGRGVDPSLLVESSFQDAANYCDQIVDSPGGNQKRYTLDGIVDTSRTIRENLIDMLATCRGLLCYSSGKWTLRIDRPEVGITNWKFNEDNITGRWSISTGTAADRPNRVKVSWIDPDEDFQPKVSLVGSAAMLSADRDKQLDAELNLNMVTDRYRAEQLAGMELKQARQSITTEFTATITALRAEVSDVIKVSHETPGWIDKPFRIWRLGFTYDDLVRVQLREYDESVFVLDDLNAKPVRPDTHLPDPWLVGEPTNLQLFGGTADLLIGSDGTIVSRLYATWEPPIKARALLYEVEFKPSNSPAWIRTQTSSLDIYLQPVLDRHQYDVRVRSMNAFGLRSQWVTHIGFTVTGKTEPPPDVEGFYVSYDPDGTRIFSWSEIEKIDVPDLAGYVIRYAIAPASNWDSMLEFHTGFLTSSPYEANRPPGGAWTFAIRAIDTSGNLSATPSFFTIILPNPRLGNVLFEQYAALAGWPGTKTDCILVANRLVAINDGTWADLTTWAAWTLWPNDPRSPIMYTHTELDFGGSTNGTVIMTAAVDGGTETLEMRFHDGSVYGAWAAPPSSFTAKTKCQMRVTVTGSYPRILALNLTIYE